jgi:anti-sigma B factor antagonist
VEAQTDFHHTPLVLPDNASGCPAPELLVETMVSVLLVDDEPEVLASIQSDLAVAGFHSRVAWTGAEATELVRQRSFDLVVIDTGLPDVDGVELVSAFKALRPQLACIVLAPAASREASLRALSAGALAYVVKPIQAEQITHIVRERRRHTLSHTEAALSVPVAGHRGFPVLMPAGDLDLVTAPLLQRRVDELIAGGHRHLLIDAAQLGFCDSSGLRVLLSARRWLQARSGDLALVRVGGLLRRLLELSHGDALIRSFASEEEAIASFEPPPG